MKNWRFIATIVAGAAGGALCIGLMEYLSVTAKYPLMTIPFATSIVLVMGTPEAAPAQPRALIGGHLVSTLAGLVVLALAGPSAWAAALAVGGAIAAMHATAPFHLPAWVGPAHAFCLIAELDQEGIKGLVEAPQPVQTGLPAAGITTSPGG